LEQSCAAAFAADLVCLSLSVTQKLVTFPARVNEFVARSLAGVSAGSDFNIDSTGHRSKGVGRPDEFPCAAVLLWVVRRSSR
jgi:hypothetical protein